jgi:hypothetical protein
MPEGVSQILGVAFPSQGVMATPFVTTAPSRFRSRKREYSIPDPKVPDATIPGFLRTTPAILTLIFWDIRSHSFINA